MGLAADRSLETILSVRYLVRRGTFLNEAPAQNLAEGIALLICADYLVFRRRNSGTRKSLVFFTIPTLIATHREQCTAERNERVYKLLQRCDTLPTPPTEKDRFRSWLLAREFALQLRSTMVQFSKIVYITIVLYFAAKYGKLDAYFILNRLG